MILWASTSPDEVSPDLSPWPWACGDGLQVFAEKPDTAFSKQMTSAMEKSQPTKQVIAEAVANNSLLADLTPEEIDLFVTYSEKKDVSAGDVVAKQGESGDQAQLFYVIEQGSFEVDKDGKRFPLSAQSFGELALLFNAPRAATITATTSATLWAIDRVTFRFAMASAVATARSRTVERLKNVEVIQNAKLNDDQLGAVVDAATRLAYKAGQTIIKVGTVGHAFYIIDEGTCIVKDIQGADASVTVQKGEGEFFGEKALLTGDKRNATIVAETNMKLLAIERKDFEHTLGMHQGGFEEVVAFVLSNEDSWCFARTTH